MQQGESLEDLDYVLDKPIKLNWNDTTVGPQYNNHFGTGGCSVCCQCTDEFGILIDNFLIHGHFRSFRCSAN